MKFFNPSYVCPLDLPTRPCFTPILDIPKPTCQILETIRNMPLRTGKTSAQEKIIF